MPEGMDTDIGARVKVARIAKGLTQTELAGLLGRTENWLYGVEAGRIPLDRYSLITAIAENCDVDVVWLLGQPYRLQRSGGAWLTPTSRPCGPACVEPVSSSPAIRG